MGPGTSTATDRRPALHWGLTALVNRYLDDPLLPPALAGLGLPRDAPGLLETVTGFEAPLSGAPDAPGSGTSSVVSPTHAATVDFLREEATGRWYVWKINCYEPSPGDERAAVTDLPLGLQLGETREGLHARAGLPTRRTLIGVEGWVDEAAGVAVTVVYRDEQVHRVHLGGAN